MSYALEFSLPGLPKMNTGFSRGNRFAQARETTKWKSKVHLAVIGKLPSAPLAKAKLTLTRCSSMEPDFDNLVISFKPILDGLVEADVLVNDRSVNVGRPEYLWERAGVKEGRVKVRVEEITTEGTK